MRTACGDTSSTFISKYSDRHVRVLNRATKCASIAFFPIPDIVFDLQLE